MDAEADDDCAFLEQVLDKLYDFGNGAAARKKLKSHKKKKRKRCEEEEEEEEEKEVHLASNDSERHAAAERQSEMDDSGKTAPAVRQVSQVEVVTFQDPTKKRKTKQTPAPHEMVVTEEEQRQSDQLEELNLEKARLEVHRFGITGYKKEQQRVFEQDRAVMLGARAPKKEYVNYKVLQQQVREKKKKAKEEVQPDLKKKKKSNPRDKKKASSGSGSASGSGSSSAPSGQVGRFKNGMLILSSKEIQKIKGIKKFGR